VWTSGIFVRVSGCIKFHSIFLILCPGMVYQLCGTRALGFSTIGDRHILLAPTQLLLSKNPLQLERNVPCLRIRGGSASEWIPSGMLMGTAVTSAVFRSLYIENIYRELNFSSQSLLI
jgi:hypothetical protein